MENTKHSFGSILIAIIIAAPFFYIAYLINPDIILLFVALVLLGAIKLF